jgi:hypothetical protein
MPGAREDDFDPIVEECLPAQPLTSARGIEQVDRTWLDDPGADAAEDMLTRLPLQHQV